MVTLAEITGLDTLQARPRAALEGTKTYGTFYSPLRLRSPSCIAEVTHLFFAQEREMEKDFERLCISSQNDEL